MNQAIKASGLAAFLASASSFAASAGVCEENQLLQPPRVPFAAAFESPDDPNVSFIDQVERGQPSEWGETIRLARSGAAGGRGATTGETAEFSLGGLLPYSGPLGKGAVQSWTYDANLDAIIRSLSEGEAVSVPVTETVRSGRNVRHVNNSHATVRFEGCDAVTFGDRSHPVIVYRVSYPASIAVKGRFEARNLDVTLHVSTEHGWPVRREAMGVTTVARPL